MGDLLAADDDAAEILRNIAPVAPDAVLERIEAELAGTSGARLIHPKTSHRWQLTMLLKSLAFDPGLFDRAATIIGQFVAAESLNENHNSARGAFEELFHLRLSGTRAPPEQRRRLIRSLFGGGDDASVRCGFLALRALLESGHFSSSSNFDFGARSRDFGWHAPTYGDVWDWYSAAVDLTVEIAADPSRRPEARRILSSALRGLLRFKACLDAIEAAVEDFLNDGEWIDGWLAVRSAIRFDETGWQPEVRERVLALEVRLRPSDPLNIARAYVLEGRGSGFGLLDGDKDEEEDFSTALARLGKKAESIGREFGGRPDLLDQFLPEALQADHSPHASSFGVGLAESGVPPTEMWARLRDTLVGVSVERRQAAILGGFLHQLQKTDAARVSLILDEAVGDPRMASSFVYLQSRVGIDGEAIERLRKAIQLGQIEAHRFYQLASGVVGAAPQGALALMLDDLSALPGGTAAALEILHMAVYCLKSDGLEVEGALLDAGHRLLLRMDYANGNDVREYRVQQTIKDCYNGPAGEEGARELCRHIKQKVATREVYAFQLDHMFDSLFEAQPRVALDEFMLSAEPDDNDPIYGDTGLIRESPLAKVEPTVLWEWAESDPAIRYPLISKSLPLFATKNFEEDDGLSSLFLEALERSPDRSAFLKGNTGRLHPSGWSGNLSAILDRRAGFIEPLTEHVDLVVRAWAVERVAALKRYADHERTREGEREESFE